MATNTTNYNLVKPAYADTADIADINGNMDIIDGQMKTNADGVSSTNSSLAKTEAGLAVIVTGDTCPVSVPAGGYAYIKSNTHGLTEGLYRNKSGSTFPTSGGTANSTVFESVSRGGINALKGDIDTLSSNMTTQLATKVDYVDLSGVSANSSKVLTIGRNTRAVIIMIGSSTVKDAWIVNSTSGADATVSAMIGISSVTAVGGSGTVTITNTTAVNTSLYALIFAGSVSE